MSLFSDKKEERVRLEELEDIYNYTERLHATAREYGGQDEASVPKRRRRSDSGDAPEAVA